MPDQLTTARDQIAEMCGWSIADTPAQDGDPPRKIWKRGVLLRWDHPIPACLNFVSRAWPGRFYWPRSPFSWSALEINRKTTIRASKTNDELADRMTLLLKVLVWLRDNDRPAFAAACEKIRKEVQG